MREAVDISRTKDEGAAKLEWVFLDAVLAEAGRLRFLAAFPVLFAEQVEDVGFFEVHGLVRLTLLVDEQRESDSGLLDEGAGEDEVAETNGGQVRSALLKLRLMGAQLRDVLTAEDSAVVTKEDEYRRPLRPQEIELHGTLVRVRQDDASQPFGVGGHRGSHGDRL